MSLKCLRCLQQCSLSLFIFCLSPPHVEAVNVAEYAPKSTPLRCWLRLWVHPSSPPWLHNTHRHSYYLRRAVSKAIPREGPRNKKANRNNAWKKCSSQRGWFCAGCPESQSMKMRRKWVDPWRDCRMEKMSSPLGSLQSSKQRSFHGVGPLSCARSRLPQENYVYTYSIFSNLWLIVGKLWEALSRLYRSRFLQVNSKYSFESSWRELQGLQTFAPLRMQQFS